MPFLDRPGATIFFETSGSPECPVVTLINGHTRTSSDFKMMARSLVERGLKVLVLDNRGAGRSRVTDDFDLREMVADVVAIWDHLEIASSHVMGISMGGMITQWLAGSHPDRIQKLVLISTCPNRSFIRDHGSYAWSDDEKAVEAKLVGYFSPGFMAANRALVVAMAKQMAKSAKDGPFLLDASRQMRAMEGFDATPLLANIAAPTLIIHGASDMIVPPDASRVLARAIHGSTVKLFEGAGHLLLAERPKDLYDDVARFFLSASKSHASKSHGSGSDGDGTRDHF